MFKFFEKFRPEQETWKERPWVNRLIDDDNMRLEVNKRQGFNALNELKKRKGAVIEIAGPTEQGFFFHDMKDGNEDMRKVDLFKEVKRHPLVSNLYPGVPNFMHEKFSHFFGKVDFIADAKNLPTREGGVDVIFASCLGGISGHGVFEMLKAGVEKNVPTSEIEKIGKNVDPMRETEELREQVLEEAWKVLSPGGLLVWQGSKQTDLIAALRIGFTLLQSEKKVFESSPYSLIFIKESKSGDQNN